MMKVNVHAVVVTFCPDDGTLRELLHTLSLQVAHVHLVDNTPSADTGVIALLDSEDFVNVTLIRLGKNMGIARGLNEGIEAAIRGQATHVLLSDQDSLPARDMVHRLLQTLADRRLEGSRVGAVGPTFNDRNTGITFPFQADVPGKFFYGHVRPDRDVPIVEALTLITSGCLIPVAVLNDVGDMREDLFIDQVDIEWCHRARAHGWRLFGTSLANMSHSMGDQGLRVWYFGWRRETAYSPLRLYYRIRNFIALCRIPEIDWRWKLRNAWYSLGVVYSQVCFGTQRWQGLGMALRGAWDGLRGRMGPYQPE